MTTSIYEIALRRIDGREASLAEHKGEVLLIVNVASKCGLTPQYDGLEKLHDQYGPEGLAVLGFPANEFAGQEPGTNDEIQAFCTTNYGVQFPMFEKIVVKGEETHPLYVELIKQRPSATPKPGGQLRERLESRGLGPANETDVMWNFEKFLVDRQGQVVGRFAPDIAPDDPILTEAIEAELAKA